MKTFYKETDRNIFSIFISALALLSFRITRKRGNNLSQYFTIVSVIAFSICSYTANAATYYIAPNGSDAAIGDITHPFATLKKAWTIVVAGDLIYMRGGTYNFTTQQALAGKNGTAGNLIKVWAYTGETPVVTFSAGIAGITLSGNYISFKGIEINGLTTISGWTNAGNGIYTKSITCQPQEYAPAGSTNIVTIDGVNTPLGRYPNATATNGGYLTIDSHSGTSSITDIDLPSSPNFTGGELVVRRAHWVIDRSIITNHASQTITYAAFPGAKSWDITEPRTDGYGYFIQNHINTLDQFGEWCYNGTTLSMYFGTNSPTSYIVKASTVNDLFYVSNSNNVSFDNMTFQGGNCTSFKSDYSSFITVQNCAINYSGKYAIHCNYYSTYVQILNSVIKNSNSCAILLDEECDNALISGNRITNTGALPGMVAQIRLKGICEGISSYLSDNTIVEYNKVINTGYNSIRLEGIGSIIRNNLVNTFCYIKDDGAGIYFHGGDATIKREVKNNIVLNGIGANAGTTESNNPNGYIGTATGIYMDDETDNIEISGNTVSGCCYDGISIHNALRINAHDNLVYNNRNAQIDLVHDTHGSPIRNAIIDNNVAVSLGHESMGGQNVTQKALQYGTVSNDITLFGTSNNNYFISPLDNDPKFYTWFEYNSGYGTLRNFAGWKTYSGQDANSHLSPITVPDVSYIRFEYNDTTVNKIVALSGTYIDAKGVQYIGSITLLPYTSNVLMRSSSTNQVPSIQNQGFQLNENSPVGTAVGTVIASDPDAGQALTYSILSGNTNSAFAINVSSGAITVANSSALNYEAITSFALIVKVQDNGPGNLSSQATITITLLNLNEPPVVNNQNFSVVQLSANGTQVGTVLATDPDVGQILAFAITSGNTSNAFSINANNGIVTVITSSALNLLVNPVFTLNVRVTDNGSGNLFDDAIITINVTQSANQPPVINNQTFSISSNSANGTIVGNVVASDPDAGQTLTYSILSGNTNGAFAINASNGAITVVNSAALANNTGNNYSLFQSATPSITQNYIGSGTAPLEIGMKFLSNTNGYITGLRYYKGVGAQGIHIGNLWSIAGVNLASATFTGETASGWQTVTFATPVAITANTIYVVSYFSPHGDFVKTSPYFATDIVNGPLTGLGWTAAQPNGVYIYSSTSAFPNNNTYIGSTNYWADVLFSTTLSPASFALVVKVQDNGPGSLSNQANITINLLNGNTPPTINDQTLSVSENSPNGTTVGSVVASDPDAGQTLTFSILSGNTNGTFAINTNTGALTVASTAALNFEVTPSFTLVVKVQDNGIGNLSNQATITISLLNVNELPVISNQAFSLSENSPNGTAVGSVVASDPDAGQTLAYSIVSGNATGAFIINTTTGSLTVANSAALNFEVTPSFTLVVKVQDNGTGNLSSQATITVTLINVNELPVISNQTFSLSENSPNGTAVGTVVASDPDAGQALTYSIVSGNTNGAFTINTTSGAITVATTAALNFEITPSFALIAQVMDNGTGNLSSQATITITLLNVNEPPVISNQTFSVVQLAANGTQVGTVVAIDPDAGQLLSFSITSGNTSTTFGINSSTGIITVTNSAALVYLTNPFYYLNVRVTDNGTGSLYSNATITINVLNSNQPPVISNQAFTVGENSANGTIVGNVVALDPDAGQALAYSILSGNTNNAFTLNSVTGAITVANSAALNYEVVSSFALIVKVQDNGTGNLSSQATITITLLNVNEPPTISNQSFSISENSPTGTTVGSVVAFDPDAGQTLAYSILSGSTNGAFAINTTTGAITVANASELNFEVTSSFSLVVKVQDNGTGNLSNMATISITLLNVNEPPAISNQSFSLNENSPAGTIVGSVVASDPDAGQSLAYSILSGNTNNAFLINATTGILIVANTSALNFEATPSFNLVIKVQDNGAGSLSSQSIITVTLLNLNEPPSISDQFFSSNANSPNGTTIGTVIASDPDAGQTLTYSFLSGNTNNAFAISTSTGEITVANATALVSGGANYSLFQSTTPSISQNYIGNGSAPLEIGMKFFSNADGYITGLRYYKGAGAQGIHIGNLWSILGVNLASATFTGETTSGWQTVNFTSPVAITANTIYVVSYFSPHGDYAKTVPYFTADIVNGPLTGLGWTAAEPNGIYRYSSNSVFPDNNTYIGSTNYWADVIFSSTPPPTSFELVVNVQDNGTSNLSSQATITINLQQTLKSLLSENITNSTSKKMRIFPNPVTNKILNVELEDGISKQFDLVIFDMTGKSLLKRHYEQTNTLTLDLSAFPAGAYALQIHTLNFNFSDKFILK